MNPTCLAVALCLFALPAIAAPEPAEQAYQAARKGYYALKRDPKRRKFRDSWLTVAHRFEAVAKKYPKSARAPDSLFTSGQLLSDLSRISLLAEDATASMEDYRTLLEGYPRSSLADDAALALARAYLERDQPDAARKVLQRAAQLPRGDQTIRLRALAASLPPESKDSGRKAGRGEAAAKREPPAADARTATGRDTPAEDGRSDQHPASTSRGSEARPVPATRSGTDARSGAALTVHQAPTHPVETPEWLKQVTSAKADSSEEETTSNSGEGEEHSEETVSVERTVESPRSSAASESDRRRTVAGTPPPAVETARPAGPPDAGALLAQAPPTQVRERLRAIRKRGPSEVTLAEQLGLKVRRVVIDPGHGGHDTGTIGADGTREKDVALAIAKKLRTVLTEQGLEVVLTRETDHFVRLEERARLANVARGDLFISVHCNSLPQRQIRGIETYTLNLASDRYAIRLAARENATSEKGMSDLQFLLADLATRANTEESARLATQVQSGLVSTLRSKDRRIRDLGTKEALFYVLLGTKMPAILVETGFLSNSDEEKRLGSPDYQQEVARAIAAGVQDFLGNRERLAKAN
ncbi:MAG TPA: N-acetylmuramoyl-L-alanine amidase [Myxococcaceae bacterium]|nr:N-acetylmuramoyl-L-alanine amidase [Myxococcaceae bacterium]